MVDIMFLCALNEGYEVDEISLYEVSQKLPRFIEVINSLPTLKMNFVDIIGDINKTDENSNTLLKDAILRHDAKAVKSLLDWPKIDINKSTSIPVICGVKDEDQPFLLAVGIGNVEIVQTFLTHPQTNIKQQNQDHETALIIAVQGCKVEVFKLLISYLITNKQDICANGLEQLREYINLKDSHNHTALYYAVDNYLRYDADSIKIIQILLALQDDRGEHLVSEQEQHMFNTMLLDELDKEYELDEDSLHNNIRQKLLMLMEVINSFPKLSISFVNRMNINQLDENGNTLLTDAILRQDSNTVKYLLECFEIDINKSIPVPTIRCPNNDEPFLLAVGIGNTEIVQAFLTHPQINIKQQNQNNETALIIAAQGYKVEVFKLLVSYLITNWQGIFENDIEQLREYINLEDSNNHTALYYAIDNYLRYDAGSIKIIQILLALQDNRGSHLVSEKEQDMFNTMILDVLHAEYELVEDSLYNHVRQKLLMLIEMVYDLPILPITLDIEKKELDDELKAKLPKACYSNNNSNCMLEELGALGMDVSAI
ncbi:ankyrin repeat domain-containing protein [Candidatus Tisiphia endosymbiont of Nemotelus uliginosus]|uniref:ankyrin repeat domain-containing protein n=1 Tax=Candidatus Tisiphia endosymbiont of Nemotelus uliginosus TaxID=3077926 RepID=UPI0035C8A2E8